MRRADHQARRAQYAVAMCRLDGIVDFDRQAEVVCRYDELLQDATSRRSFRKRKNSRPSRRRRRIICGLRAISATIEAILGARK
jgi:hypothetical protein